MVAIINTGHSIRAIFKYNENKVAQGLAECIGEGNYPMEIEKMTTDFKLTLLLRQLELNENVTRNSVHISLNFDRTENGISKEKLVEIADTYMEKIGFGSQPYLIYQHHDAGHPHIHIVSIKVKANGQRIDMQNIGKNQSETARKEIEIRFDLVRAEQQKNKANFNLVAGQNHKIKYGATEAKKAMAIILQSVIPNYKYTTIGELNAVLNLYNVSVLQGKENSKMLLYKGLMYQILDPHKKCIGVPIQASSFYFKPTLSNLEKRFESNKKARLLDMKRVRNHIDLAYIKKPNLSLDNLEKALEKEGIKMVFRKNSQGLLYGITYIDHTTKCVFNGSTLGVKYAAKAIQERSGITVDLSSKASLNFSKTAVVNLPKNYKPFLSEGELQKIIDTILQPEFASEYVARDLKFRRKKRKRKGPTGH